jgi:DNA invertase Pin-like site-specific DNA recombinase
MATYGYVRVSTDDQALGLQAQRSAILAKYPDAVIEADQGVSGADPERPAFARIVEQLAKGDTLVVVRRDRLARDTMLAAMFDREVERRGARLLSLEGATTDANDPSSILLRRVLDAVAEFERAMIRARTRAALTAKKAQGRRVGAVPFGFTLVDDGRLVANPAEQQAIAAAKRLRKRGKSLRDIAAALEKKGVRNKAGRPLAAQSVKQMLAAA